MLIFEKHSISTMQRLSVSRGARRDLLFSVATLTTVEFCWSESSGTSIEISFGGMLSVGFSLAGNIISRIFVQREHNQSNLLASFLGKSPVWRRADVTLS